MTWPAHREYILPKRNTLEQFLDEGAVQAAALSPYIPLDAVVLEHGCGVGRVLQYIDAPRRIGLDVSPSFLEEAARHGLETLLSDGITIDLPDQSVDFVFSIMVFQHLDRADHPERLREIRRVLKPDGGVFLQFPAAATYYEKSYVYSNIEVEDYAKIVGGIVYTGDLVAYADGRSHEGREWLIR